MKRARDAYRSAPPGNAVIGWKLDGEQRAQLLSRFPPSYACAVADHVTLKGAVHTSSALPRETGAEIVGRSDDGAGVEAMVVRIDGSTQRPDGGTYHITWSLAEGRDAFESNRVIAERGWEPVEPPVAVRLEPSCFTWHTPA